MVTRFVRSQWYWLAYYASMIAFGVANWHYQNTDAALTFVILAATLGGLRVSQLEDKIRMGPAAPHDPEGGTDD